MSSYNPSARAGYTKTGKSLKAVRRYYALLNQQNQPKQKSPDDDKLSKRIAAELKTQQDANEKRSRRETVQQPLLAESDMPTERSELPPLMVSAKETGPVFIAPPPVPPPPPGATKSAPLVVAQEQTNKTTRSLGAMPGLPDGMCSVKCLYFITGVFVGVAIGIMGYYFLPKLIHRSPKSTATTTEYPPLNTDIDDWSDDN